MTSELPLIAMLFGLLGVALMALLEAAEHHARGLDIEGPGHRLLSRDLRRGLRYAGVPAVGGNVLRATLQIGAVELSVRATSAVNGTCSWLPFPEALPDLIAAAPRARAAALAGAVLLLREDRPPLLPLRRCLAGLDASVKTQHLAAQFDLSIVRAALTTAIAEQSRRDSDICAARVANEAVLRIAPRSTSKALRSRHLIALAHLTAHSPTERQSAAALDAALHAVQLARASGTTSDDLSRLEAGLWRDRALTVHPGRATGLIPRLAENKSVAAYTAHAERLIASIAEPTDADHALAGEAALLMADASGSRGDFARAAAHYRHALAHCTTGSVKHARLAARLARARAGLAADPPESGLHEASNGAAPAGIFAGAFGGRHAGLEAAIERPGLGES